MGWSIRIARVSGIDIFVHLTFPLILIWVVTARFLEEKNWGHALEEGAFVIVVFGIVVIHELGHAVAAQRYGIRTRDITLLPIGGVARLERMPDKPGQELTVALAGPAVNFVLAAGLYVGAATAGQFIDVSGSMFRGTLLGRLFWVNILLAVFNLLPAFPMDGGRALRALLAMRMDYVRATQVAASIGQSVALFFAFVGLFFSPFLIFIALFVWIGAAQEASMVQLQSALEGIPVERAMVREFRALAPQDTLQSAVEHVLNGFQHDFPVVDGSRLVGVLTRSDLLSTLAKGSETGCVADVMRRKFETTEPSEMLALALKRLESSNCSTMPVLRKGNLDGILTLDNIGELIMIQSALRGRSKPLRGSREVPTVKCGESA
jgi:Zn-dependent protease/CBS domain-containing protein